MFHGARRPCRPRLRGAVLLIVAAALLGGCGLVAKPIRATSNVVKKVPGAGDVISTPLDATSDIID